MKVQYTGQAIKQIKSLDKNMKRRIKAGIEKLPMGDIKKLKGFSSKYRLRVGDYRVIYEISGEILIIDAVLPRGSAYKSL